MLGLVVALAADSPEITSAVTASVHGQKGIGIGVLLGSNVFNLAALLGLGAIVARTIFLHRRVVILEGATGTWIAAMTLIAVTAGWPAGVGLALVLVAAALYVMVLASAPATLIRLGMPHRAATWLRSAVIEEEMELAEAIHPTPRGHLDSSLLIGSLIVVVAASALMERTAEVVGNHFHASSLVIGGVVLAAVTSLPNAVGAVYLAKRGRGAAMLSVAMNSNMINVVAGLFLPGLVLGLGAATTDATIVAASYALLTVASLAMAYAGRGLNRRDGLVIVTAYASFVAIAVATTAR